MCSIMFFVSAQHHICAAQNITTFSPHNNNITPTTANNNNNCYYYYYYYYSRNCDLVWWVACLLCCAACAFMAGNVASSRGLLLRTPLTGTATAIRRGIEGWRKVGSVGDHGFLAAAGRLALHLLQAFIPLAFFLRDVEGWGREQGRQEDGNSACGADVSMMEQLLPEIIDQAMRYLDFKSLCLVSMTNSRLRKAANNDNLWKALFGRDFTAEQNSISPCHGWKAHYAVTKAVFNVNESFYIYFSARSLRKMSWLWLHADYCKFIPPDGEILSGHDRIMQVWLAVLNWSQRYDFQLQDVRVRVHGDMAWVTLKEYLNTSEEPLLSTNCFEFHGGRWYMVHHQASIFRLRYN